MKKEEYYTGKGRGGEGSGEGRGGDGEERQVLAEAARERKYLKRIKGLLVPAVQHNLSLTLYKNIRFSPHFSSVLQRLECLLAGFSVSPVEAGLKGRS